MPACDARYDVLLDDGHLAGFARGIPRGGEYDPAVLDFLEDRLANERGDPGRLVAAQFVHGVTRSGLAVREARRGHFAIGDRGVLHRVFKYDRRYVRWRQADLHVPIDPDYDPPVDPEYDDPA